MNPFSCRRFIVPQSAITMQKDFCVVQYFRAFAEFPVHRFIRISFQRAIVNRSRVYPPLAGLSAVFLEGLPAVFLVRRLSCPPSFWRSGGLEGLSAMFLEGLPAVFVAGWPADHLMAASFT